ncbi:hypothetical protein HPB52_024904 [Rhipicephalus sanguineus]|uniref:Uncharacterized protein n=1 Tax=Rhipicephalus sanguineus TaxID=34632 RepID=A0A9D4SML4_RHISA|nr:hypothetical protein HPB52_024904 [Rhipicephalus sanguineus]
MRAAAAQSPLRRRCQHEYYMNMFTTSRSVVWPAVLPLAESVADPGEASPRSAVQHSSVRGLANGHGCADHSDSSASCPLSALTIPAWSIASPMRVDCSRSRNHAVRLRPRRSVALQDAHHSTLPFTHPLPVHLSVRRADHRTVRSPNFVS